MAKENEEIVKFWDDLDEHEKEKIAHHYYPTFNYRALTHRQVKNIYHKVKK